MSETKIGRRPFMLKTCAVVAGAAAPAVIAAHCQRSHN